MFGWLFEKRRDVSVVHKRGNKGLFRWRLIHMPRSMQDRPDIRSEDVGATIALAPVKPAFDEVSASVKNANVQLRAVAGKHTVFRHYVEYSEGDKKGSLARWYL